MARSDLTQTPARISRQAQRTDVPLHNPNSDEHRRQIAVRLNSSMPKDGSQGMSAPLPFAHVNLTDLLPPREPYLPELWEGSMVYIASHGYMAWSNGVRWVAIGAPQKETLLTPGDTIFTPSVASTQMDVQVFSGGGGSGAADGQQVNSRIGIGGGGATFYVVKSYTRDEVEALMVGPAGDGTNINVVVGARGVGGIVGNLLGGDGGVSTFAPGDPLQIICDSGKGSAGLAIGNAQQATGGGSGGTSGASTYPAGSSFEIGGGGFAGTATAGEVTGGDGGASHSGPGGQDTVLSGAGQVDGNEGVNAGSGAGGPCVYGDFDGNGADGGPGLILIHEYF